MRINVKPESPSFIERIAVAPETRDAEFRARRRSYDELTVTPGAVSDYTPKGWTVLKEMKSGVRLRKEREADENLENRFWCCLYRLGYSELNVGRHFKVTVSAKGSTVQKQIDVFARDEETVVVAECKTAEENKKKPLQMALAEFDSLKRPIADAIRKHYGKAFKPKVLWLFVTDRIEWSDNDRSRAAQQNTKIITERDLNYIDELSRILGPVARHQFKATYLQGVKIPELEDKRVPAVRCKIGGKIAYVFSAHADDIIRVSFVNHRDLRDPRGTPSYQRLVNPYRLKKISEFLVGGGYFPNTILLNFRKKPRFDLSQPSDDKDIQFGHLYLPDTYKSCWVVDGQHRLYGCALLPASMMQPTLAFIAFEAISADEEAKLFTTINREQQKVQRRLLDELDGDLKWDSPNKSDQMAAIASRAIDLMNNEFGSPFEDKVKLPSVKDSMDRPLDLPQIRQAIISSRLIGRVAPGDKLFTPGPFYDTNSDKTLARVMGGLNAYFRQIRAADPDRWESGGEGRLCNNFGVPAHIRFLSELIQHVQKRDSIDARELTLSELNTAIEHLLQPVTDFIRSASEEAFRKLFNVTVGSGGIPRYYFALCGLAHASDETFCPPGFEAHVQLLTQEQEELANKNVNWVQNHVHQIVVSRLREVYGPDFFDKAITNKEIQKSAYAKLVDDDAPEKQGPEGYLDFIELKKIVESKENWPHFQEILAIPLPGERKGQSKHIKWFDEINRIRRISAHPYGKRYNPNDIEILKTVCDALTPVVQQH